MRIILFLFILALASCTVQKRVHLKGWDVQWKKSFMSKSIPSEEKKAANFERNNQDGTNKYFDEAPKNLQVNSDESHLTSIEKNRPLDKSISQDYVDKEHAEVENESPANENSAPEPEEKKTKKELSPVFWRVLFIVLGSIMIVAAIFLFIISANATITATASLALIGGVVLTVLGLIIILAMVVMIYTNGMLN